MHGTVNRIFPSPVRTIVISLPPHVHLSLTISAESLKASTTLITPLPHIGQRYATVDCLFSRTIIQTFSLSYFNLKDATENPWHLLFLNYDQPSIFAITESFFSTVYLALTSASRASYFSVNSALFTETYHSASPSA